MRNRIASKEQTEEWPTRERHRELFEETLANAYATALKIDAPIAFLYLAQTEPKPTQGLVSQLVVGDASEVLAACLNMVKTAKGAGKIDDEQIHKLMNELEDIAPW